MNIHARNDITGIQGYNNIVFSTKLVICGFAKVYERTLLGGQNVLQLDLDLQ